MRSPRVIRIRARSTARLDRALAEELAGESRTSVARLIREGHVLLNGRPAKPSSEVAEGDTVTVDLPEPVPSDFQPEDLPIGVVFEDEHLAVIDKPAGMVTHPAGALRTGTLVNALLARFGSLSSVGGTMRPGIVHRLDKGTTGLLVVAKQDEAHRHLSRQLAERTLSRTYEAVVWGRVAPDAFVVDAPIARHPRDRKRMAVVRGGKEARSRVKVLHAAEAASYLEVSLETGRTHQIRVHLRHRGHPLLGDSTYGGRRRALAAATAAARREADELVHMIARPALHAARIRFQHPFSGAEMSFESPIPADLEAVVDRVRSLD